MTRFSGALALAWAAALASPALGQGGDPLRDPGVARVRDGFKVDGIALFDPHAEHGARMGVCAPSIFAGLKWCVSGNVEETRGTASFTTTTGYNIDAESRIVYAVSSRRGYPLKRDEFDAVILGIGERFGTGPALYALRKPGEEGAAVDSLIAVWGGLRLVHLSEAEYLVVEAGGSLKRGHLVDHRFNLVVSAKQREPVYKIEGEAGYILHLTVTGPERADVIARVVYQPAFAVAPVKPPATPHPLVADAARRPSVSPDNASIAEERAKRADAERALAAERLLREEAERKAAEEQAARAEAEKKLAEARRQLDEARKAAEDRGRRSDTERKAPDEQRARAEAERKAAEKAEAEKAAADAARRAKEAERAEAERKAAEDRKRSDDEAARRKAAEKAASEKAAAEKAAAEQAAREKADAERRQREEAERKLAEERRGAEERHAREELARKARAREEAEQKARAEAERKAAEEAARRQAAEDARRAEAERRRAEEAQRAADEARRAEDERADERAAERKAQAERAARERAARPAEWYRLASDAAQRAGAIWSLDETQDRASDERVLRTQTVFVNADGLAVEVAFECTLGRERRLRATARGFDRRSGAAVVFRTEGEGAFGVRTRIRIDDQPAQDGLMFREHREDVASIVEVPVTATDLDRKTPRASVWLRHYAVSIEFNLAAGGVTAAITPYAQNLRRVLEACAE